MGVSEANAQKANPTAPLKTIMSKHFLKCDFTENCEKWFKINNSTL